MKKSILILAALLGIASCVHKEGEDGGGHGYLTISVSDNPDVEVQVKSDESGTSEDTEAEETIIYSLDIIDSKGNVDHHADDHTSIIGEKVKLMMDKYTVVASSGHPETGFNLPYWYGENSVRIYPDKEVSVELLCKMQKVIFSVSFPTDEEFTSKFEKYTLTVTAGEDELVFSSNPGDGEGSFTDVAYLVAPSDRVLTYKLWMKNADGAEYSVVEQLKNVSVAEHYHFNFSLGDRVDIPGALVLGVFVNGEYKEEMSHDILLNFDKLEMPSYGHNPEFTPDADGLVYPLGNEITKKFTFKAPRKIKSLVISHMDANLLKEGLPQVMEFVNISTEDRAIAEEIGIVHSEVTQESVEAEIEITEFIKKLHISPENENYLMSVTVIDSHDRYARCDFEFTIVSDIQAETVSVTPWSSFATLKGRFFSKQAPAGASFQYKKVSDEEWTEIDPDKMDIDLNTLTYSYRLKALDVNTDYVFRATSDKDKTDGKTAGEVGFKTYATENTVYNLSFDDWVKVGKAWYATNNSNDVNTGLTWDSANEGTSDILGQSLVPTTPEETITISGKAARMESGELLSNFAAGNIYTGDFGSATISPVGAKLKWGIPFDSRPLALRGWYRYEPVAINRTSSAYSHLSGQTDFCQIQIFLTNWSSPFEISTGDNRFVDTSANNPAIIAHGEIISQDNTTDNEGNTNGYVQFTIPLQYRNLNQPTYIVISGAASRYGDYFTGGLGSTMYLDELELIYDPDELTDEEFELVMGGIQ